MLEKQLIYTAKADAMLLPLIKEANDLQVNKLFWHVLTSKHIWISRVFGAKPKFGVWDDQLDTSQFEFLAADNHEVLIRILDTLPLATAVTYKNTSGQVFTDLLSDILFHIINHSTYHRGQIAQRLHALGFEIPATDYIILNRNKQL